MAWLNVWMNAERMRRLDEIAGQRGMRISEVVRCLIDDTYEVVLRERRREAVRRLVGQEVENPPSPAALSRELEAAHEPCGVR